ncbi:MAG TPA: allophanate hydrolase subunit 1 [Cytophagales bacterium]|nr:allophanate hydrolase subunit 1 [Cytophagales bacterium]
MQHPFNLTYKSLGSSAILIEWINQIDEAILYDILSLQVKVETDLQDVLVETINAYNSLTIIYNPNQISFSELKEKIKALYEASNHENKIASKKWMIPVCYDQEFGIDLEEISKKNNFTIDEIIEAHSRPDYVVYFTGFLPGFLYLGGLPKSLHMPRRATPRVRIRQGAVAIGGAQTGIYPSESPGGWNIIGNSPLIFFDPSQSPPCFAKAGDHLQFYSINKSEYDLIAKEITSGKFIVESKAL